MRELSDMCPKIQLFYLSWCFLRLEGGGGGGVGRIWSENVLSEGFNVLRKNWKNPCLSLFHIYPYLPLVSAKNLAFHPFINYFSGKCKNRATIIQSFILTTFCGF